MSNGLSSSLGILFALVDGPIEDIVVLKALADEEIAEQFSNMIVAGFVIEVEGPSAVQVRCEFNGHTVAQNLGSSSQLLLHDWIILLVLGSGHQPLPGERAAAELNQDVAQRFHIVSARLLDAQMSINGSIAHRTS